MSLRSLLPAFACLSVLAPAVVHAQATTSAVTAVRAADFLSSIGACSDIDQRGEHVEQTASCASYLGLRWIRTGIEVRKPVSLFITLHQQTGLRFSWSTLSGGTNLTRLIETARELAAADALLAFEGPNEPNNWGITYQGEKGGGKAPSWLAVAKYQRDLYQAVKSDPLLKRYPVWGISETGAEKDNVGLQYLVIPPGAGTLMPEGTRYADFAVCHNYIIHSHPKPIENRTWNAADPTAVCQVDGLFGNYGVTWGRKFRGYSEAELLKLPRVTTETGCTVGKDVTEQQHGLFLLSMYLDQFKRGWRYTSVYLLRDRSDEGGNQAFGFYKADYTPRLAGVYLHNLTTILADPETSKSSGSWAYAIPSLPATAHDLLLQKNDGTFALVVWGERVSGSDAVTVDLGTAVAAVKIYDPTVGTEPVQTLHNVQAVPLTLNDHPLIVSWQESGAAAGHGL